jgi:hypothetical protein
VRAGFISANSPPCGITDKNREADSLFALGSQSFSGMKTARTGSQWICMTHLSNLYIFIHCCIILDIAVFYTALQSDRCANPENFFTGKKMLKIWDFGYTLWL